MIDLRATIDQYLLVRRSLGYKLKVDAWLLGNFATYCERIGATTITAEAALAWARSPAEASATYWVQRLTVVRRFATYLQALDPATEVPPVGVIRAPNKRATPFIYSEADVTALMTAARGLRKRLGAATYEALFGLLAVSGLRVGEAIRLDRDDVNWESGLLRIRESKFSKSREVPLHPRSLEALRTYAEVRDGLCPTVTDSSFFVSSVGKRLHYSVVRVAFVKLVRRTGLRPPSGRCRPRIHDYADLSVMPTLDLKAA